MNFNQFIFKIKTYLQENKELAIYPELKYNNKIYAINEKGRFYDKTTKKELDKNNSMKILEQLFNNGDFRFYIKEVFEI